MPYGDDDYQKARSVLVEHAPTLEHIWNPSLQLLVQPQPLESVSAGEVLQASKHIEALLAPEAVGKLRDALIVLLHEYPQIHG
jgi:hypothetical protein